MSIGLGEILQKKRLEKNLTIEDVEEKIKVRKKYIKALEREDFDSLPAKVYTQGFIKSYSRLLGLDENNILEMYRDYTSEGQDLVPEKIEKIPIKKVKKSKKGLSLFLLIAFLSISLIFTLWPRENNISPSLNDEKTITVDLIEEQEQLQEQAQKQEQELVLYITIVDTGRGNERAWVYCSGDEVTALEETLKVGDTRQVTAKEKIYIKVGNAGVVNLKLGDKDLGLAGELNQVVEKEFTQNDLE